MDIFRAKLSRRSIRNYFKTAPKGKRGQDFDQALAFVTKRFKKIGKSSSPPVSCEVIATTAVDSRNAQGILNSMFKKYVRSNVVEQRLV